MCPVFYYLAAAERDKANAQWKEEFLDELWPEEDKNLHELMKLNSSHKCRDNLDNDSENFKDLIEALQSFGIGIKLRQHIWKTECNQPL